MDQNQKRVQWSSGRAWIAAGSAAFFCILVDAYVISAIRASYKLYEGLGRQLPLLTLVLLATRPQYFALFFFGAAFLVIAKEFVLTDLRDRWLTTATIFIIVLVAAGLTKFILHLPLLVMANKLSDSK